MIRGELLARFDAEMRRDPPAPSGEVVEVAEDLVIARSPGACVLYSRLDPAAARRILDRELARAKRDRLEFEWKLYRHDPGPDLRPFLASAGMRPAPAETFVVLPLAPPPPPPEPPAGVEVRRISTPAELEEGIRLSEAAFGPGEGWSADGIRERLASEDLAIFVARTGDGRCVAAGRLEMPAGRSFASLWGGATDPAHRGRGIYRALVAARANLAQRRGFRYLTVDARETSRPILARLGFEPLTAIEGWTARP